MAQVWRKLLFLKLHASSYLGLVYRGFTIIAQSREFCVVMAGIMLDGVTISLIALLCWRSGDTTAFRRSVLQGDTPFALRFGRISCLVPN